MQTITFPPASRPGLERALVDPEYLRELLQFYDTQGLEKPMRYRDLMEEERQEEVLGQGLSCLKAEELAVLAVNPIQLLDLRDTIMEEMTDYWWGVTTQYDIEANLIENVFSSHQEELENILRGEPALERATAEAFGPGAEAREGPGEEEKCLHWSREYEIQERDFRAIEDPAAAAGARKERVALEFSWYPERGRGTLEVQFFPLVLTSKVQCTGRLGDKEKLSGPGVGDQVALEERRLLFPLNKVDLSSELILEIDYQRPGAFRVVFQVAVGQPGN